MAGLLSALTQQNPALLGRIQPRNIGAPVGLMNPVAAPVMADAADERMAARTRERLLQDQAVTAQQPRERVSGWRVLDRFLFGDDTISTAVDAERTRLQQQANSPAAMERQRQILATIEDPRERALFLASPEQWTENVGKQFAPVTAASGTSVLVPGYGGRPLYENESREVVGDRVVGLGTSQSGPRELLTVEPSFKDRTDRFNAENPVLPANSTWVGPDGVRAQGYIAPEVVSTPQGGTTTVLDAQGRVINSVQGNPDRTTRKSYEDSLGVRRFEDTGEPVFPDDFARIRSSAQDRVTAADQSAENLTRTINEALELSGAGETGVIGSVMGAVPGSRARRLRAVIETIKSNVGFNYLQQMRELSPTGGALGSVAQQELQSLQSVWGNLDPNASEAQLDGVLRNMLSMVEQGRALRAQAFNSQYGSAPAIRGGQGGIAAPQSQAEYLALPSGTQYRAPDGSVRRKP